MEEWARRPASAATFGRAGPSRAMDQEHVVIDAGL